MLRKQLWLARKYHAPVMLRCPPARLHELLRVLAPYLHALPAVIIMDYLGDLVQAMPLLDAGFYIGISVRYDSHRGKYPWYYETKHSMWIMRSNTMVGKLL